MEVLRLTKTISHSISLCWAKIAASQMENNNILRYFAMNSFKLFGLKGKLDILCPIEVFFELHSSDTHGKKVKEWVKKGSRNFGV